MSWLFGEATTELTTDLPPESPVGTLTPLWRTSKMVNNGSLSQLQDETGKEDLVSMFIDLIRQSENDGQSEVESDYGTNGVAC